MSIQTVLMTAKVGTQVASSITKVAHMAAIASESAIDMARVKAQHKFNKDGIFAKMTNSDISFKDVYNQALDNDHRMSKVMTGRMSMTELFEEAIAASPWTKA